MPHIWNNILVVTETELVPAWYNTSDTLKSNIRRYKDKGYGIKKVQSGGNGRQMLVAFDSLSPEIQNGIGDPRKNDHLLELFYNTDQRAVSFFTTYRFDDGGGLSLKHQEEYITNASVLAACVSLHQQRIKTKQALGGSTVGVMATILADAMSFNKTLKVKHGVEHTLPSSEKRFKQAFNEFAKPTGQYPYNYASLISGKLRNQSARKVTDDVMDLLNALFAGQNKKPSRTEVYKVYNGFLQGYIEVVKDDGSGECYNPKDFTALSDATIINYLGNWSERIGTYAKRSGDRQKLIGQFKTPHSLDRPQYAGSIISVDDRQPPFEYAPGERMWWYNGIDLASEAWTVWVWGKSKEGIIMDFYRQMVRNYSEWGVNLPLELEAEASLNSSYTGTFLQPGRLFDYVRIEANNARGKRIERYFGSLRYEYEKQREGWLARPFAHREQNQAGPSKKQIVPYDTIIEGCLSDMETWNNQPHSLHPEMSRWDYFIKNQNPNTHATNWHAILPYLGYRTATSVGWNGTIRLNNAEFLIGDEGRVHTGQRLVDVMEEVGGKDVECLWLDDNSGKVLKALVLYNNHIICEAVAKPTYNRSTAERTPKDVEARTIMSAYVSTIEAYMRNKRNSITEVLVIDNTPKVTGSFKMPGLRRNTTGTGTGENMGAMPGEYEHIVVPTNNNNSFIKSTRDRI